MAHYFIFPEKDTTIYSHTSREILNTGMDEILTLRDEPSSTDLNYYPSRILIQFKQSEVNNVISNKVTTTTYSASLNLFQTEHKELSIDQNLEVFPISSSWNNGTGRFNNIPTISDGCSWLYRDGSPEAFSDDDLGTKWATSSLATGVTASWISASPGGGTWYTGSGFEVTKSYSYNDNLDLSFNLTSPISKHVSNSLYSSTYPNGIENNGFLIKRANSQEHTAIDDGELNFFSMDTHTIFPPYLDISWDDSEYAPFGPEGLAINTSSANTRIKSTGECYITLRNNKEIFRTSEEYKFRLNVRELYPTRKFTTTSNFLDVNYFTSRSFYSLVDYATEETLIPFGEESKLSADSEGMHFKLYMNGLQEDRYYKLLFKHENDDGIQVYDDDYYFKVTKT
tara:strand:+ start:2010 stop:3200 length:1191 start_codon:yes stop_codon:yes gene_type:complete